MKLKDEDVKLFYKLHSALLFYTNQKAKLIKDISTVEELRCLPIESLSNIMDSLCDNTGLIDSFVKDNPFDFSLEELEIVQSWKNMIKGKFFVVRYLKKYAVFHEADSSYAFGVVAITNEFEGILGVQLPIFVETILLPFKGRIIYSAFIKSNRITFGSGIRQSISDSYQKAKAEYGIITALPFTKDKEKQSEEELLKFYLKSKSNREYYEEEIWDLIDANPALSTLYHLEMGKISSRYYKRKLKEIGIINGWFGLLEGTVVSAGKTKRTVEETIEEIVPQGKRDFVYIFKLG